MLAPRTRAIAPSGVTTPWAAKDMTSSTVAALEWASQVTKAEANVPGVKTEVVMADKSRAQVIISVDDKVKKGVFDGFILVSTTDPAKKEIKIPLKGVIL